MSVFQFSQEELLTFFAVLVRFSVLVAVLPFVGDGKIPGPVKVLLALAISVALFPSLVATGRVQPLDALTWGKQASSIAFTVGSEALFALVLGYTARLAFDAINFGGNIIGTYMGYASASIYDSSQESQTQLVAEFQLALAMLIFLAIDGHHMMLRATLDSYRVVGLGHASLGGALSKTLLDTTSQVLKLGLQISGPVALSIFTVNVGFGVLGRAMPQMNLLVLSLSVTAIVGLFVLYIGVAEFQGASREVFVRMEDWMLASLRALKAGG